MRPPHQRRNFYLAASALSFVVVSALDLLTGAVTFSIFYLIPIGLASWAGDIEGTAMTVGCSTTVFLMEHVIASPHGPRVYWDDFVNLLFFGVVVALLTRLRHALEQQRKINEELDLRVRARTARLGIAADELKTFNSALAHHLRAPLRGIARLNRLIRKDLDGALSAQQREHFERIRAATVRLDALIDGLLLITSLPIADIRRQEVDLSALARSLAEELRSSSPQREVRVLIEAGLRASAEPRLLAMALRCLLENAWKFTSDREDAVIEFGAHHEGSESVYFVRDNGVGFDMSYSSNLFKPFQRLHTPQEYPGLGIGLTLARQIISRHGGRIWAEGRVDRGAALCFTLPGE